MKVPTQMAKLGSPQLLFGKAGCKSDDASTDPDADLVTDTEVTRVLPEETTNTLTTDRIIEEYYNKLRLDIKMKVDDVVGNKAGPQEAREAKAEATKYLLNIYDELILLHPESMTPEQYNQIDELLRPLKPFKEEIEKSQEPTYEPVDVPQREPRVANAQTEDDDWEVPAWEDSDEELDI